jgi:hypothetical protein
VLIRRLWIASLFGALCSYWFGAGFVPYVFTQVLPWLWTGLVLLLSHVASVIPTPALGPFPAPWSDLIAPNWIPGLIWLSYYSIGFLVGKHDSVKHTPRSRRVKYEFQYDSRIGTYKYLPKEPVYSSAKAGELKHQLVERCYEEYRKALKRYEPQRIRELKTPPTFHYMQGCKVQWVLSPDGELCLTLPEELLTPEKIHLLLPLLAHLLAWYNSDDYELRQKWDGYPDAGSFLPTWVLVLTGNFLWVPSFLKFMSQQAWDAWLAGRIYDADEFTVELGQGPAWEHMLRYFDKEVRRDGHLDRSVPTLISRVGRLEALNNKEREEMRKLGLTPDERPLMTESLPPQMNPGAKERK